MPNPNVNRRLVSIIPPTGGYDTDLLDWVSRVQGQGSDVSTSTKDAVNTFILAVKAAGLRNSGAEKLRRVQIYAGNGILALNAPLYKDWGSTTDSIVGFVSGDYAETGSSGGLTGGSGKYIETGLVPSTVLTAAGDSAGFSYHMSRYIRTGSDAATQGMGCQLTGFSDTALYTSFGGNSYWDCWNFTTGRISFADSLGKGLYVGSRISNVRSDLYKNGTSQVNTTTDITGTGPASATLSVHAFHDSNTGYLANDARTASFYSVGTGLTSTDVTALNSAVQTLQTALSRNV